MNIQTQGECFDAYIDTVKQRMGGAAAESTRRFAEIVVHRCIDAYHGAYGTNEVGLNGLAYRQKGAKTASQNITGLLYGKVQSGKTNAAMATSALAQANGFRCFVVLTSDNLLLGKQTAKRFRDLQAGPTIFDWRDWNRDPKGFGERIAKESHFDDRGVLFVCTKNRKHLEHLSTVIRAAGAKSYPALILDDEADNASLDVLEGARAAGRTSEIGRIFELIGDIRKSLPHHVYLQITATPQALLLQAIEHSCKPQFCELLQPGDGYIGGEYFFGPQSAQFCREVAEDELTVLREGRVAVGSTARPDVPAGLRKALDVFFLGCAQKYLEGEHTARFSFLAHCSIARVRHDHLREVIDEYRTWLDQSLRGRRSLSDQKLAEVQLQHAYEDLAETCRKVRPIAELRKYLEARLGNVPVRVINADSQDVELAELPIGPNVFVGGNRLGRGVTIDGLMVTYYGRDAKAKMMDTVHQHARMFGYRRNLLDVTRLYSSSSLLQAFKDIHEADERMRRAIETDGGSSDVKPVWVGAKLKPTRANVLDLRQIGVFGPGKALYPWAPVFEKAKIAGHVAELDHLLEKYKEPKFEPVPLDFIRKVVRLIPSIPHQGWEWSDERVQEIFRELGQNGVTQARLHVRRITTQGRGLKYRKDEATDTGYGPDIIDARKLHSSEPVLFLRRLEGRATDGWNEQPFWAPTLVLPSSRFVFMFSNV